MTGIPSNETIFVQRTTASGDLYYITAKPLRDVYYIYKIDNDKADRLGKSNSPLELERKFIKEQHPNSLIPTGKPVGLRNNPK